MDYLLLSSFSISGLHKKYTFVIIWTLSQRLHKKQEQTDTKNRLAVSALSNSWLSPSPQPVSFTFSCAAQYSVWPRSNINILRNKWTITTKFHTHTNTFWKHQKQKMCLRLFMPLSCSGFWRHKGLKFFFVFCFCIKPLKYTRKKQTEKKIKNCHRSSYGSDSFFCPVQISSHNHSHFVYSTEATLEYCWTVLCASPSTDTFRPNENNVFQVLHTLLHAYTCIQGRGFTSLTYTQLISKQKMHYTLKLLFASYFDMTGDQI